MLRTNTGVRRSINVVRIRQANLHWVSGSRDFWQRHIWNLCRQHTDKAG